MLLEEHKGQNVQMSLFENSRKTLAKQGSIDSILETRTSPWTRIKQRLQDPMWHHAVSHASHSQQDSSATDIEAEAEAETQATFTSIVAQGGKVPQTFV